jgi:GNAT superfamily N-acetyltransferase
VTWRAAGPVDAGALTDLERAANLASLGHVFAPERHPYPYDEVLARWCRTLVEPGVTVDVRDDGDGLLAVAAYDGTTLRHLAVHPDHWGAGVARQAVDRATASIRGAGSGRENRRARGFYEHLGWSPTGAAQPAEWPPHPEEMEYALDLGSGNG